MKVDITLQYTTARPRSILQSMNRYAFNFLNAYLPSEATSLIIFIPGTIETRAPLVVLKLRTPVWVPDTRLLADDGTVDVRTMQREHLAIHVSLGEINLHQPSASAIDLVPSSVVP